MKLETSNLENFILNSDSYKYSHHELYPEGIESVYSYLESRGGLYDEVVWYGLQYILKKHFIGVKVTKKHIEEAKKIIDAHMGPGVFNEIGWKHIVEDCGGKLPLRIKALPEGTIAPNSCVLATVENTTGKKSAFLTNFSESLLMQVWYPTTAATNSREMLKIIKKYLEKTADNLDGFMFKLHDFGFRGSTSAESAALGGSAHLVNSMGTDTVVGLILAIEYYNAKSMPGYSIKATEHSIMCSWKREGEFDAVCNLLEKNPTGIVACVSDTYNIFNACKVYSTKLKDLIMSRDGTFVVRPDSGYPPDIVCEVLRILCEGYSEYVTYVGEHKRYKLLPSQIRVIQGDGIDHDMLEKILAKMQQEGYSADNLAFGSGGGLLQNINRDTLKMAFKASSFVVNGERRDERKDPITDKGKRSKIGRLKVIRINGNLTTVPEEHEGEDLLQLMCENGELLIESCFDEIKERAKLL